MISVSDDWIRPLIHPRRSSEHQPSPPAHAPSDDLDAALRAARGGDEAAFSAIYRALTPGLLRYVRTLAGADAEDVVAEAWLQIVRDLSSFSGTGDDFRAWTARVARNRALDHLRRDRARPQHQLLLAAELADQPAAEDAAEAALTRIATNRALELISTLPREQAEAVLLRVVVGLDAAAAGTVLGKGAGAVRTASHRGLKRLAGLLTERGDRCVTKSEPVALSTLR